MLNITIVEDNPEAALALKENILRYGDDYSQEYGISVCRTAGKFLTSIDAGGGHFDLIFMDIELPDGNGMDVVRRMRESGSDAAVVFVTNLANYAVGGYEVDAIDFIVKPVTYATFKLKFKRILQKLKRGEGVRLEIKDKLGVKYIYSSDVEYIEVMNHTLVYHMSSGEDIKCTGILKSVTDKLKDEPFSLCNRCFCVNLKYVRGFDNNSVKVGNSELAVSQPKRKEFLRAVTLYFNR